MTEIALIVESASTVSCYVLFDDVIAEGVTQVINVITSYIVSFYRPKKYNCLLIERMKDALVVSSWYGKKKC